MSRPRPRLRLRLLLIYGLILLDATRQALAAEEEDDQKVEQEMLKELQVMVPVMLIKVSKVLRAARYDISILYRRVESLRYQLNQLKAAQAGGKGPRQAQGKGQTKGQGQGQGQGRAKGQGQLQEQGQMQGQGQSQGLDQGQNWGQLWRRRRRKRQAAAATGLGDDPGHVAAAPSGLGEDRATASAVAELAALSDLGGGGGSGLTGKLQQLEQMIQRTLEQYPLGTREGVQEKVEKFIEKERRSPENLMGPPPGGFGFNFDPPGASAGFPGPRPDQQRHLAPIGRGEGDEMSLGGPPRHDVALARKGGGEMSLGGQQSHEAAPVRKAEGGEMSPGGPPRHSVALAREGERDKLSLGGQQSHEAAPLKKVEGGEMSPAENGQLGTETLTYEREGMGDELF